ncbi:hypothetical protein [Cardiobacterium valvarum]|uniref:Uncharacterized protein n=1 Tax=Cardiobacterium valvarum F0432 TaxID=797473 RepID=G9ZJF4_9GAMM|nr:hypothetical protein [Cardiobacterium valvarum]EHM49932.1 hypothetical protein HMPREF9080_02923 [Cardiobacterium valvarum F0432]
MLPIETNPNSLPTADLQAMSTEMLKAQLAKAVSITAEYLAYIAMVWQELERRGEDMTAMRHGLMAYVPMIANKELDARVVVNYAGQKTLIALMSNLPLQEQQALIERGSVDIVELGDDKQQLVRTIALGDLTASQAYQAFGDGEIRPVPQQYQLLLLRDKEGIRRPTRRARVTSNIKIDGDYLVIANTHKLSLTTLRQFLREHNIE